MLHARSRAGTEQAQGRLDVHAQGALGIGIALGNEMNGRQMKNRFGFQAGQGGGHLLLVGQVHFQHPGSGQIANIRGGAVAIVQHHDLFARPQQLPDKFIANKTQTAGNNIHDRIVREKVAEWLLEVNLPFLGASGALMKFCLFSPKFALTLDPHVKSLKQV